MNTLYKCLSWVFSESFNYHKGPLGLKGGYGQFGFLGRERRLLGNIANRGRIICILVMKSFHVCLELIRVIVKSSLQKPQVQLFLSSGGASVTRFVRLSVCRFSPKFENDLVGNKRWRSL